MAKGTGRGGNPKRLLPKGVGWNLPKRGIKKERGDGRVYGAPARQR